MKDVIVDGVRYIPDPTQTKLQEPPKTEKFIPEFDGQLCEVSDVDEWPDNPMFIYMKREHSGHPEYPYLSMLNATYKHCRPIQNQNIYQFRGHDGSAECPCDRLSEVIVKTRDGQVLVDVANEFCWEMLPNGATRNDHPKPNRKLRGCVCQICGKKYLTDIIVHDELWKEIMPVNSTTGSGLMCGSCIFTRIENLGRYGAYRLDVSKK